MFPVYSAKWGAARIVRDVGHLEDVFGGSREGAVAVSGAGGILVLGPLLMILFRQECPRWWFD
jgi:hypothetical protein